MKWVLSLCDRTGNMVKPWAEAGHQCLCVDIQHKGRRTEQVGTNGGTVTFIPADVFLWELPPGAFRIAFAFSPCTDLAVSGARWFPIKGIDKLHHAISLVKRCVDLCRASGAPWMLENPVGVMNSYWPPTHKFDPCDYAGYRPSDPEHDAYTKKTCLWTSPDFIMPDPRPVVPVLGSKMHLLPPSADRGDLRSETPLGFAYAVYEANRPGLKVAA